MNSQTLFESIKKTVLEIEAELRNDYGFGIYFAPELYVAFCIGKKIFKQQQEIFGTDKIKWLRETCIGSGGPSDIIFKSDDVDTVIELKLRSDIYHYKADIEKLKMLPLYGNKFFCVLLDSFSEENDGRLKRLEEEYAHQIHSVGHFAFLTWNDWYSEQIFCNLNLYEIKK